MQLLKTIHYITIITFFVKKSTKKISKNKTKNRKR